MDVNLANVRRGPGMDQTVVDLLARGTRVSGTVTRGWLKIGPQRGLPEQKRRMFSGVTSYGRVG